MTTQHQVERGEYKIEEGWDGIKAGFLQRPGVGQVMKTKTPMLTHNPKVGRVNWRKIIFPPGRTSRSSANKRWLLLAQASSAGLDSRCTFTEPDSSLVFFRVTPSVRLGIDQSVYSVLFPSCWYGKLRRTTTTSTVVMDSSNPTPMQCTRVVYD